MCEQLEACDTEDHIAFEHRHRQYSESQARDIEIENDLPELEQGKRQWDEPIGRDWEWERQW